MRWGLISLVMLLAVACTPEAKASLLGQWQGMKQTDGRLEFSQDGTVNLTDSLNPESVVIRGTYQLLGENQLQLNFASLSTLAEPMLVEVVLSDQELTLTFPGDQVAKYQRVK